MERYSDFKQWKLLANRDQINKVERLKDQLCIVGLSGGKDSVATCILLHWLEVPFKTVTAEVWWKNNISGENPLHYDFIHDKLIKKLNSWGVHSDFIKSDITAYEYMTTPIAYSKEHPERVGKLRGFPLCSKCGIQRDCKSGPCGRYYKSIEQPYTVVTGIASDERERILSNYANHRVSVLEMLNIEEFDTFPICMENDLLSPVYRFSERGGCWFCPNQKITELFVLYWDFPWLWDELMKIQKMPNKAQECFNRTQTLYDIEKEILNGVQMRFFTSDFIKT